MEAWAFFFVGCLVVAPLVSEPVVLWILDRSDKG